MGRDFSDVRGGRGRRQRTRELNFGRRRYGSASSSQSIFCDNTIWATWKGEFQFSSMLQKKHERGTPRDRA
jgi:hypothetical protein